MSEVSLSVSAKDSVSKEPSVRKLAPEKFILDATAGDRLMWFDRQHPNTLYFDQRPECNPTIIGDFRKLDFPDESFFLVVFDPPHLQWLGQKSVFRRKYGALNKETWPDDIQKGANELWRVLKPFGVLIFKWADHDIPYQNVIKLFPKRPLFGQITSTNQRRKGGKPYHTYWFCFMKIPEQTEASSGL